MRDAAYPPDVTSDDPAPAGPTWHAPMLRELAELGMRMAWAVTLGAEARAQAGEATAADEAASSLALQRAAKMVRLTVALDQRLVAGPIAAPMSASDLERQQRGIDEAEARRVEAAQDAVWVMRSLWKLVGKPLVRNTVALAVEREVEAPDRERLLRELNERLVEREEELIALGPGQYGDMISGFLAELGLSGVSAYAKASADWPRGGLANGGLADGGGLRAANDPAARTHPPP